MGSNLLYSNEIRLSLLNSYTMDEELTFRNYVHVSGDVALAIPLPVMPLYDLKIAAQLIPCSPGGLAAHLSRNKHLFPPVYRRRPTGAKIRLLSAIDIRNVRAYMLKGAGLPNVLTIYPAIPD
jgi:hypothetical protein